MSGAMERFGYGPGDHEGGWRREVMEALAWMARLTRRRYAGRGPRGAGDDLPLLIEREMENMAGHDNAAGEVVRMGRLATLIHNLRSQSSPASQREMVRALARARVGERRCVWQRLAAEGIRARLILRGYLTRETPPLTLTLHRRVVRWCAGDHIRFELADEPLAILAELAAAADKR